jgi:NMD protein affecting ribosome stability and mRNA decay
MKQHDLPPSGTRGRRTAGRAQDDHVVDTYRRRKKLPEPTRCPNCGAIYHEGRWQWAQSSSPPSVHEETCPACHRIADKYPAGIVTLRDPMLTGHKPEIVALARNLEAAEKGEHALNRIIAIEEPAENELVITTTDIHLPRRIGEAVERAFHGHLKVHYDEGNYFVRVDWRREAE